VRISFGKENTEEEIRFAANAFVEAVNDLRKF
jgi:cysteine sulfinate desulfinase/cysteine desulfurase-like protein